MAIGKFHNLAGNVYGELTVLEIAKERGSRGEVFWNCKCDCGKTKNVRATNLTSGLTKSCGCLTRGRPPGSTGKIPDDLKDVESVFLKDDAFQVFKNGRIFRNTEFGMIECPISIINKYPAVSTNIANKQKHFYVHRLMAEAFIPNPNNKPQVNHIDGNKANNDLANLEWATAKENVNHAYRKGLAHGFSNAEPCEVCGNPTNAKDQICPDCKAEQNRELRKMQNLVKIAESVSHIDTSLLTEKQKEIVELRKTGKSFAAIGRELGITRQAVESSLKTSEKRMKSMGTLKKRDIDEITRLTKRKKRIETKKLKLLSEIEFLDMDLENIEASLNSYEDFKELVEV